MSRFYFDKTKFSLRAAQQLAFLRRCFEMCDKEEPLVTPAQAAIILGCTTKHLQHLDGRGVLPCHSRLGNRGDRRWRRGDVLDYSARLRGSAYLFEEEMVDL